jgi:hypothetical protein
LALTACTAEKVLRFDLEGGLGMARRNSLRQRTPFAGFGGRFSAGSRGRILGGLEVRDGRARLL